MSAADDDIARRDSVLAAARTARAAAGVRESALRAGQVRGRPAERTAVPARAVSEELTTDPLRAFWYARSREQGLDPRAALGATLEPVVPLSAFERHAALLRDGVADQDAVDQARGLVDPTSPLAQAMFDRPDLRQASAAALAPTDEDPMRTRAAAVDAVVDRLVSHPDGEPDPEFLGRYDDAHAAAHDEIGPVPAGPVDLAQARVAGQARAELLVDLLERRAPDVTSSGPASSDRDVAAPPAGDRPARQRAAAGRRSGVYDQFRARSHDRGEAPLRLLLSAASTSAALVALGARATTSTAASLGARTGRAVASASRRERLVDAQPVSAAVARRHPVAVPQPTGQRLDGPQL